MGANQSTFATDVSVAITAGKYARLPYRIHFRDFGLESVS